jgi:hypothetical protein
MNKMKNTNRNWLKLTIYLVLSVGFVSAMAMTMNNRKPTIADENNKLAVNDDNVSVADKKTDAAKKMEEESKAAFLDAYRVFMHPRCMNCHPSGDVPLIGDDSQLHPQGVKRGPNGKGLYALKCSNCHQEQNIAGEHMPPGNDRWKLPSAKRKMVFQGKTAKQLAMHFKDNNFTGFKNWKEDLLHHVEFDPLVLNGWTYGTRPPLSHQDFVAKVREWIEKGAVIP